MSSFDTEIGEDVGDGLGISEAEDVEGVTEDVEGVAEDVEGVTEDVEGVAEDVMGLISQNMKNLEDGKTGSSTPNNGTLNVT